jgi:PHD/YefM family antitoxin component YafN of YafNO toxin-antitoxin module
LFFPEKKRKILVDFLDLKLPSMICVSPVQAIQQWNSLLAEIKNKKQIIAIKNNKETEALLIPKPQYVDIEHEISRINANSPSFEFLNDEPEIYSISDLKKKYV